MRHTITRTSLPRREPQSVPRDRRRPVVMVTNTVPSESGPPPYSYLPAHNEIVNPPPYTTIPLLIIHSNGYISPSNEQYSNSQSYCHDNRSNVGNVRDLSHDGDESNLDEAMPSQVTWDEILPPEGDGPPPYDSLSMVSTEGNTGALLPQWLDTQFTEEETTDAIQIETVPLSDDTAASSV